MFAYELVNIVNLQTQTALVILWLSSYCHIVGWPDTLAVTFS